MGIRMQSLPSDTVSLQNMDVELRRIRLDELFSILPYMPEITGLLSAEAHYIQTENSLELSAEANIDELTYERQRIGDVSLGATWLPGEAGKQYVNCLLYTSAPLGSIIGYNDLLVRLTEDERQRFYLDNMRSSSQHLLKLVSDLLDFHRLDLNKAEVNRVTFNPSQFFEEIRISFEPLTAAKGLVLRCKIAPELEEHFISDPLRIRQIVNNLLSNACLLYTSRCV